MDGRGEEGRNEKVAVQTDCFLRFDPRRTATTSDGKSDDDDDDRSWLAGFVRRPRE